MFCVQRPKRSLRAACVPRMRLATWRTCWRWTLMTRTRLLRWTAACRTLLCCGADLHSGLYCTCTQNLLSTLTAREHCCVVETFVKAVHGLACSCKRIADDSAVDRNTWKRCIILVLVQTVCGVQVQLYRPPFEPGTASLVPLLFTSLSGISPELMLPSTFLLPFGAAGGTLHRGAMHSFTVSADPAGKM